MSADARSGLRKIRALGIDVDDRSSATASPQSARTVVRSAPARQRARSRRRVRLRRGDAPPSPHEPLARRIRGPLARLRVRLDQQGDRTFLLSRITSDVEIMKTSFDVAAREHAGERARGTHDELAARQQALAEIAPGTEAAFPPQPARDPLPGRGSAPYVDAHLRRRTRLVRSRGASPNRPTCVSQVISRLRRVLASHAAAHTRPGCCVTAARPLSARSRRPDPAALPYHRKGEVSSQRRPTS